MSYQKQNFVDGQVLKARHLNYVEDAMVELTEATIKNCTDISEITNNLEKSNIYVVTEGMDNNYTVTIEELEEYSKGFGLCIEPHADSTGASTLNINGLGAIEIKDALGNSITAGGLKTGIPYNLRYNGVNFILQGKGGGGNATPDKLLEGYKATVDSGQIVGTMPNNTGTNKSLALNETWAIPEGYHDGNGKVTQNITNNGAINATLNAGGSYTVPAGYHNGSGKVTANSLASQTSATATAPWIISGQTAWVNGSKITGNMPNLTSSTPIQHESNNATKVVKADGLFIGNNTDGVRRVSLRYSGGGGYITGNTLFGLPEATVASSLGITANKIVSGNNVCGVAGNATVQSLGGASKHIAQVYCAYGNTYYSLPFIPSVITCTSGDRSASINLNEYPNDDIIRSTFWLDNRSTSSKASTVGSLTYVRSYHQLQIYVTSSYAGTYNLYAFQ